MRRDPTGLAPQMERGSGVGLPRRNNDALLFDGPREIEVIFPSVYKEKLAGSFFAKLNLKQNNSKCNKQ